MALYNKLSQLSSLRHQNRAFHNFVGSQKWAWPRQGNYPLPKAIKNAYSNGSNGTTSPHALNGTSLFSDRNETSDVLIIGCGIAGCAAALKSASLGLNVRMISAASDPLDCNSYWAQGGIIYKGKDDSPDLLAEDIHYAGANICDHNAVDFLTQNGPSSVDELLLKTAEVPFDRNSDGELALCLEASHNRPRIIHWKDHTGKAITKHIQKAVLNHPNITLQNNTTAVDLAVALGPYGNHCVGVHALDRSGLCSTYTASATVLATGTNYSVTKTYLFFAQTNLTCYKH